MISWVLRVCEGGMHISSAHIHMVYSRLNSHCFFTQLHHLTCESCREVIFYIAGGHPKWVAGGWRMPWSSVLSDCISQALASDWDKSLIWIKNMSLYAAVSRLMCHYWSDRDVCDTLPGSSLSRSWGCCLLCDVGKKLRKISLDTLLLWHSKNIFRCSSKILTSHE